MARNTTVVWVGAVGIAFLLHAPALEAAMQSETYQIEPRGFGAVDQRTLNSSTYAITAGGRTYTYGTTDPEVPEEETPPVSEGTSESSGSRTERPLTSPHATVFITQATTSPVAPIAAHLARSSSGTVSHVSASTALEDLVVELSKPSEVPEVSAAVSAGIDRETRLWILVLVLAFLYYMRTYTTLGKRYRPF